MSTDFSFNNFGHAVNYLRHLSRIRGFRPHHHRGGISVRGEMTPQEFVAHVLAWRDLHAEAPDVRDVALIEYAEALSREMEASSE